MICYDYREMAFEEDLTRYDEIHLVAWSMGVRMAELALGSKYTFATATAINGTPCPIDDAYGIPVDIFRGTLDNLTAEGLHRFNRRMCGTREIHTHYQTVAARPFDEVRDELQAIYDRCSSSAGNPIPWTRALVGSDDRIFPVANQLAYWSGRCNVTQISSPHYPFTYGNNGTNYNPLHPCPRQLRPTGCGTTADQPPTHRTALPLHSHAFPACPRNRLRNRRFHPFTKRKLHHRRMVSQRPL